MLINSPFTCSGEKRFGTLVMPSLAWGLSEMCVLGLFHSIKLTNEKEVMFKKTPWDVH